MTAAPGGRAATPSRSAPSVHAPRAQTRSAARSRARRSRVSDSYRDKDDDAGHSMARGGCAASCASSFHAQLPERTGVIGPVGAHFDPQLEMYPLPQELIELEPRRPADALQPLTL